MILPVDVWCPFCKQSEGYPCVSGWRGKRRRLMMGYYHQARERAQGRRSRQMENRQLRLF